ncbi:hypothetical protein LTR15_000748 [Elasticomyces elasticus]|nr:hypothetical protein LTR15_000748 [Elasticomyces elasticus]
MQTPCWSDDEHDKSETPHTGTRVTVGLAALSSRQRALGHGKHGTCRFNVATCPGCPSPTDSPKERKVAEQRLRFLQVLGGIRSPKLFRDQTVIRFMECFFPFDTSHLQLLVPKVLPWLAPLNSAMTAANDAVLLIGMGVAAQNERLLNEGRSRYGIAVRLLNAEIQQGGSSAARDDGVLGTVHLLGACELYTDISLDGNGWRNHARGLCALLRERDPKAFSSPVLRHLLQTFRQTALIDAMQSRKACMFGEPKWLQVQDFYFSGHIAKLSTIVMPLPAVFEHADALYGTACDTAEVAVVLTELAEIERELLQWRLRVYRTSRATPPRTSPTNGYRSFTSRFSEVADTFPTSLVYDDFMAAIMHLYFWGVLAELRRAVVDVARLDPEAILLPNDEDARRTAAVDECTDSMCQSMPPMIEQHAGSTGGVLAISGPIKVALQWYRIQRDQDKHTWCHSVEQYVDSSKLNTPTRGRNALMKSKPRLCNAALGNCVD